MLGGFHPHHHPRHPPATIEAPAMTHPIYAVTVYEVTQVHGAFHVMNTLDHFPVPTVFDSLREALEYADNGELSPDAVDVLLSFPK